MKYELSDFLIYLVQHQTKLGRIPPLSVLSQELGVSVASLREQMESARVLGLVEAKPKLGIRQLEYTFAPPVLASITFAASLKPEYFNQFSDLRNRIEEAYWFQATSALLPEDIQKLHKLVQSAKAKLNGHPIRIPHEEHRGLHLTIFSRINNTYVIGLLESYWDLYETIGYSTFSDLSYLSSVWDYHEKIVNAISIGDFSAGFQLLKDHQKLINQIRKLPLPQNFE
jgi:DNA-binding FadR family transcriptional regulator